MGRSRPERAPGRAGPRDVHWNPRLKAAFTFRLTSRAAAGGTQTDGKETTMGRSLPLNDPTSLRIVIGEAETRVSSVEDVVKFLRDQEAGDLADFLLSQRSGAKPASLGDVCARMEALCAMV